MPLSVDLVDVSRRVASAVSGVETAQPLSGIASNDSLNTNNDRFDGRFDLQGVLVRFQAAQYKVPGQRGTTEASGGKTAPERTRNTPPLARPVSKSLATRTAVSGRDNTHDTR